MDRSSLEGILRHHDGLQLRFVTIEEVEDICEYAKHFRAWTKQFCTPAIESGDPIQINQCKIRLLDRLFDWRAAVPKSHRNRIGEQL